MKLAMPDGAVAGVSIEGAQTGRKTHYDGRIVEVSDHQHLRALKELGAFPVNLGGRTAGGYRCKACDFSGFFAKCGRCGGQTERED